MTDKTAYIHPSAIVEEGAVIGAGAHIGPFCYIGSQVEIGEGTVLKSHVVVNGVTKIGRDNTIYQFATIGEVNQDLKYAGEPTRTEIGDRNSIRESVTIHRGTTQGGNLTKIGDDNLLMVNAHVAHDCVIGNRCILANNATLGGHVHIDDFAIIGGMTAIHQFCVIGAHVMGSAMPTRCSTAAVKRWKRHCRKLPLSLSSTRQSNRSVSSLPVPSAALFADLCKNVH